VLKVEEPIYHLSVTSSVNGKKRTSSPVPLLRTLNLLPVLENIVEANCSPNIDVEDLQETTKYAGSVALNGRDSPPLAESCD
jgi:hypothetical protein